MKGLEYGDIILSVNTNLKAKSIDKINEIMKLKNQEIVELSRKEKLYTKDDYRST